MANTLGAVNPLRYRGYVFDSETQLYYLQSRYYDPELGRFINADALVSTGQGILGNNMFAYCGNNPATTVDPSGNAWCKISFDAFSPFDSSAVPMAGGGGGFMGAVFAMNSADSEIDQAIDEFDRYVNNTSEATVLNADYYAFYKGKLVIRINGERSGSFGIIFLTRETNNRDDRVEIIRHEYGHTVQLDYLGPIKYFFCIFIPSADKWGNAPYYDRPQEITANIFGGANLGNPTPAQIYDGFKYLKDSYNWGIWAWTMYDWGK